MSLKTGHHLIDKIGTGRELLGGAYHDLASRRVQQLFQHRLAHLRRQIVIPTQDQDDVVRLRRECDIGDRTGMERHVRYSTNSAPAVGYLNAPGVKLPGHDGSHQLSDFQRYHPFAGANFKYYVVRPKVRDCPEVPPCVLETPGARARGEIPDARIIPVNRWWFREVSQERSGAIHPSHSERTRWTIVAILRFHRFTERYSPGRRHLSPRRSLVPSHYRLCDRPAKRWASTVSMAAV